MSDEVHDPIDVTKHAALWRESSIDEHGLPGWRDDKVGLAAFDVHDIDLEWLCRWFRLRDQQPTSQGNRSAHGNSSTFHKDPPVR